MEIKTAASQESRRRHPREPPPTLTSLSDLARHWRPDAAHGTTAAPASRWRWLESLPSKSEDKLLRKVGASCFCISFCDANTPVIIILRFISGPRPSVCVPRFRRCVLIFSSATCEETDENVGVVSALRRQAMKWRLRLPPAKRAAAASRESRPLP